MPLTVTDVYADLAGTGQANLVITATPVTLRLESFGGAWELVASGTPLSATTNSGGTWTLALPWPSVVDPSSAWRLRLPDRVTWQGSVPEGISGPVNVRTLQLTYGWTRL